MDQTSFKSCCSCQTHWATCEDFILDPDLHVNGYQALLDDVENGIFLLTHRVAGCGTTLAITAGRLRALYGGPEYVGRRTGQADCPGLCLQEGRLEECEAECELAWVRVVLQYLRRHELPPANGHCAPGARCAIVAETE